MKSTYQINRMPLHSHFYRSLEVCSLKHWKQFSFARPVQKLTFTGAEFDQIGYFIWFSSCFSPVAFLTESPFTSLSVSFFALTMLVRRASLIGIHLPRRMFIYKGAKIATSGGRGLKTIFYRSPTFLAGMGGRG